MSIDLYTIYLVIICSGLVIYYVFTNSNLDIDIKSLHEHNSDEVKPLKGFSLHDSMYVSKNTWTKYMQTVKYIKIKFRV